jgi:outer membrane protein OmpA-like peptidoglycan-associated protein
MPGRIFKTYPGTKMNIREPIAQSQRRISDNKDLEIRFLIYRRKKGVAMNKNRMFICISAFVFALIYSQVFGLTIYGLTFAKNSSTIPVEAYGKMDELTTVIGSLLDKSEIPTIQITGYTDSYGSAEYNLKLSEARAEAVMKYILDKYRDKGLKESDFTVSGLGAVNFIGDNATDEGRSSNRRIELVITGKTTETKVIMGEAKPEEPVKTEAIKEAKIIERPVCWGCVGLGVLDLALVGYTVYAVNDQWKAADDYTSKYKLLNNPSGTNYDELKALEKTVNDKKTEVVVGSCR